MSTERKNILVLFGGGGAEHQVSKSSSDFIVKSLLESKNFNPILIEITKEGHWESQGRKCSLNGRILQTPTEQPYIDYVIPCIHGAPGETGEIQGFLKTIGLPYFGPDSESSIHCFNKVTTKMWLDKLDIPNSPWCFVNKALGIDQEKVLNFFKDSNKDVFVKAANQGSSIGCYHVTSESELILKIEEAHGFSQNVLIERTFKGRELEVSVFENGGEVHVSEPGEISCPGAFYSYEEKYSNASETRTDIIAINIPDEAITKMKSMATMAFKAFGLRHLSRVDFFYNEETIFLNEINTFPGMTEISMFPKMLEATGLKFSEYLADIINKQIKQIGLL